MKSGVEVLGHVDYLFFEKGKNVVIFQIIIPCAFKVLEKLTCYDQRNLTMVSVWSI